MQGIAAAEEPLDPEIRAFVAEMKAGFSQYPPFSHLTFAGARAVAEAVRLPWRQGGPVMASTDERRIGTDAGEVRVRIHRPDRGRTAGIAPALVYLHGGGWTLFSLDTHDRVMREYAQRAGVIVVGVDYALSPEAKFPKALEQTVGTIEWLHAHGGELGIDSTRLAVGGDSAGGNLAVAAALRLRDGGRDALLRAILLSYAAVDSECSPGAVEQYGGDAFMLTGEEMRQFWANYLASADQARDPYACPCGRTCAACRPSFSASPSAMCWPSRISPLQVPCARRASRPRRWSIRAQRTAFSKRYRSHAWQSAHCRRAQHGCSASCRLSRRRDG